MNDHEGGFKAVQAIIQDLSDRKGLKWALDEMSAPTLANVMMRGAFAIENGGIHLATAAKFIDLVCEANKSFANEWNEVDPDTQHEIFAQHVALMLGALGPDESIEIDDSAEDIIENDRDLFLGKLDDIVISFDDDFGKLGCRVARSAIRQTLGVIDGDDGGSGYHLIPKVEGQALVPCAQEVYDGLNTDIPFKTGLDIGGCLIELFDDINS